MQPPTTTVVRILHWKNKVCTITASSFALLQHLALNNDVVGNNNALLCTVYRQSRFPADGNTYMHEIQQSVVRTISNTGNIAQK